MDFLRSFNSRELALIIWIGIFLGGMSLRQDTRKSSMRVIKAFFNKYILISVAGMLTYATLEILLLKQFGLWKSSLTKDTAFWILGTAFVLLFNINK
ncbi:MAG TPA: hypothetical protein PKD09_16185, partial [Aggregatilinea sp.]